MDIRTEAPTTAVSAGRWLDHFQSVLDEWMSDFTLDGQPAGAIVQTISCDSPALPAPFTWQSGSAVRMDSGTPDREQALAMADNPWHVTWWDASDVLCSVAGRWLHPETRCSVGDAMVPAQGRAHLYVGCVDKSDPMSTDLGVIVLPVRPGWIIDAVADGCSAQQAAAFAVACAVAEAAIHEAMETFQRLGVPVVDPHTVDTAVGAAISFDSLPDRLVYPALGHS